MMTPFPHWISVTHFVNFLFLTLLVRSGIQILMDHPRLYCNDHCVRGGEWIRFTRKKVPLDRPYTARDDAALINSWIALPGSKEGEKYGLGIARHWHFFSVLFWVLNGFTYVFLLFATDQWKRLIPTSWAIFPDAWHVFVGFVTLHLPNETLYHPYNPLQQLTYAFVVFILGPTALITGPLLSPAICSRYPFLPKLFGGRQMLRTIHFLMMSGFVLFFIIHVSLVVLTGFAKNMSHMALGTEVVHPILGPLSGILGILVVIGIHVFATRWSNKNPRQVQNSIGLFTNRIIRTLLGRLKPRQHGKASEISSYHWVNGYPPTSPAWLKMKDNHFADYVLKIRGLVEKPLDLSLNEIKALPYTEQITVHYCIQGWSGCAKWAGTPLAEILKLCRPLSKAKYVAIKSYQYDPDGKQFYSIIEIDNASYPEIILAYRMNDRDLPIEYGAPLRLRVENQLGYKMVKWIERIEFISSYEQLGLGQGGYREDVQYFCLGAQI